MKKVLAHAFDPKPEAAEPPVEKAAKRGRPKAMRSVADTPLFAEPEPEAPAPSPRFRPVPKPTPRPMPAPNPDEAADEFESPVEEAPPAAPRKRGRPRTR
jgi:A/G-specific adenine glycosylase